MERGSASFRQLSYPASSRKSSKKEEGKGMEPRAMWRFFYTILVETVGHLSARKNWHLTHGSWRTRTRTEERRFCNKIKFKKVGETVNSI
jgi:hypothetical protein